MPPLSPRARARWAIVVGGLSLAAAAFISSTYFIVGDTSCALFRWTSVNEVCRPTLARWAIVVGLLVSVGIAFVITGIRMAVNERRPHPN